MTRLNDKQRKFLQYLHDEHECIGYDHIITTTLERNEYSTKGHGYMYYVLRDWNIMITDPSCADIVNYGKPTKYLK